MSRARQLLCLAYAALALLALAATWSQNVHYVPADRGPLAGFAVAMARFWPDTLATPASVSITVDIAILTLAASVFLVREARRLEMRLPWLYVILGLLVAISVTFPLFLIAREWRLARRGALGPGPGLTRNDAIAFAVLGLATAIFALWTIWR
ncbi:DUF2834 domain-containing protein [bacterium]|nr:DUF2834 domain-containing protein [bacterium]